MSPVDSLVVTYRTVVIENVAPELDGGRYAVKRVVGDRLVVEADIFKEGHDLIEARVCHRRVGEIEWQHVPMVPVVNDRWRGEVLLGDVGRIEYTVEAWPAVYRSWASDLRKKADAGQDVRSDLLEGARLLRAAAERASGSDAISLREAAEVAERVEDPRRAIARALESALVDAAARAEDAALVTGYGRILMVIVDRVRARYGSWYEIFPRSQGTLPGRGATFRDAEARVQAIAAMGFDVLYLTPIHPIGHTNRKGPENTLIAGPGDPGSPYAIGGEAGGHDAVEPALGTLDDFAWFERVVRANGMELALDFAIQASPDHPWVREHPEWFYRRPDGSIKYAENPPKKYEDIYPLNFHCEAWRELWDEMRRIIVFWARRGVRIFRVDNPHTKPLDFWEWLIREVQAEFPDVIFLSEAFTRPKVMKALAKAGFTQSYTYFTWRNEKQEIIDYFSEITSPPVSEYFRGNFFVNTPDILPEILQRGGRPAFIMRLVLAATTNSTYGMYNGFELCENTVRPGTTEYYKDSEMYQHKVWDWDRPGNIREVVTLVNQIRRDHPALQLYDNLRFYPADNPNILFYGKSAPDGSDRILVALNLDPFGTHDSFVHVPIDELGIDVEQEYTVHDLLSSERWRWRGRTNWVRLDPAVWPAHILHLEL
jgi:starch synthase (maltosyl-transferring)